MLDERLRFALDAWWIHTHGMSNLHCNRHRPNTRACTVDPSGLPPGHRLHACTGTSARALSADRIPRAQCPSRPPLRLVR
ncbi:hypothetical protein AURDEDRAFT_110200 [Auricularia subglabra TFB-10046 SS5]|nr:hypothetical protein AURDEDRAFT_110200 [Auricularia subglabra TFB-10046 SS5]